MASGSRPIVKVRSAESEPRRIIFPCGMFGLVRGSVACVACGMWHEAGRGANKQRMLAVIDAAQLPRPAGLDQP